MLHTNVNIPAAVEHSVNEVVDVLKERVEVSGPVEALHFKSKHLCFNVTVTVNV